MNHQLRDYFLYYLNLTLANLFPGKLMSAIAQTKLVLVGKFDLMNGTPQPVIPSLPPDASFRVERIAKSMTSKMIFKSFYL